MNIMEEAKLNSAYHFNPDHTDHRFDTVLGLGTFEGDWSTELKQLIALSRPTPLSTRSRMSKGEMPPPPPANKSVQEIEREFFKTTTVDYDNYPIINKSLEIGPVLKKMIAAFKLAAPWNYTCHVQFTGQVFPYHFDYFHTSNAFLEVPKKDIIRVMIMLTDWEPGHMMGYGNYLPTWKAGDFYTFNHETVPHYSANAAYNPRANIMLTGVKTPETEEFFWEAKNKKTIKVDELK
jgi:hypothetical protein